MVLIFDKLLQVVPPSVENSQSRILPVWPLSDNTPLLDPLQTVALPEILPAMVTGLTVIVTVPGSDISPPESIAT